MKLFKDNKVEATNEELLQEIIKLRTEVNSLKVASSEENKKFDTNEYQEVTIDDICKKIERGEL